MIKRLTLTLSIFFIANIYAHLPVQRDPKLMEDFQKIYQKNKLKNRSDDHGEVVLNKLKDLDIIFVGGIFNNLYINMAKHRLTGYALSETSPFIQQMKFFKQHDIPYLRLPTHTEKSCSHNAQEIREAINQSSRKVLIIAHSKGTLDVLEALVNYPETRSKIANVIMIQAPFYGTPLADKIDSNIHLSSIAKLVIKWFKGHDEAVTCISSNYRKKFNTDYQKELSEVEQTVPMIQVASSFDLNKQKKNLQSRSFIDVTNRLIKRISGDSNDGLVPLKSMCLFDKGCLIFNQHDHIDFIMKIKLFANMNEKKRIRLFKSLLELATQN